MRKVVLLLVVGSIVVGAFTGSAGATPRCCKNQKPPPVGSPPTLPATGLPLYVPVLASIGLIGAGFVLRRRTRENL